VQALPLQLPVRATITTVAAHLWLLHLPVQLRHQVVATTTTVVNRLQKKPKRTQELMKKVRIVCYREFFL
jgi:hypothetical protein